MAAISNSSPLIVFANAQRFDLLRKVFGELFVPPAVWHEVVEQGRGRPGVAELRDADWITVHRVADEGFVREFSKHLDAGEAEAFALALEFPDTMPVLIDDGIARRFARALELNVVGSAGVLVRAKDGHYIEEVLPLLNELRIAGLRLGQAAFDRALELADEA